MTPDKIQEAAPLLAQRELLTARRAAVQRGYGSFLINGGYMDADFNAAMQPHALAEIDRRVETIDSRLRGLGVHVP